MNKYRHCIDEWSHSQQNTKLPLLVIVFTQQKDSKYVTTLIKGGDVCISPVKDSMFLYNLSLATNNPSAWIDY